MAQTCSSELRLSIPLLVDDMENSVANAYSAWPDRLFILSADGKIAYRGGQGPWGFSVEEMEAALRPLLNGRP